jgi:hypothetical protein
MCVYCYATFGSFVSGVALMKSGGLGVAKTAILSFVVGYLAPRR